MGNQSSVDHSITLQCICCDAHLYNYVMMPFDGIHCPHQSDVIIEQFQQLGLTGQWTNGQFSVLTSLIVVGINLYNVYTYYLNYIICVKN